MRVTIEYLDGSLRRIEDAGLVYPVRNHSGTVTEYVIEAQQKAIEVRIPAGSVKCVDVFHEKAK